MRLMTLHKAKGLEFCQVFLPDWEASAFLPPYGDPAEERRPAYVALARGMQRVTISYCNFWLVEDLELAERFREHTSGQCLIRCDGSGTWGDFSGPSIISILLSNSSPATSSQASSIKRASTSCDRPGTLTQ